MHYSELRLAPNVQLDKNAQPLPLHLLLAQELEASSIHQQGLYSVFNVQQVIHVLPLQPLQ